MSWKFCTPSKWVYPEIYGDNSKTLLWTSSFPVILIALLVEATCFLRGIFFIIKNKVLIIHCELLLSQYQVGSSKCKVTFKFR